MKRNLLLAAVLLFFGMNCMYAQIKGDIKPYHLKHEMSKEEKLLMQMFHKDYLPTDPPVHPVRMIAEFEPLKGAYVSYDYGFGIPVSAVVEMSEDDFVTVIVPSASTQNTVTSQLTSAGANMNNVDFIIAPIDSWWVRDYGPWFIIDGNGEFGVCNFPYNRPRPNDNNIPVVAANEMGVNLFEMDLIHTGGNYMCDGWGVGASTDLLLDENPTLSQSDIDQLVFDYIGLTEYHLLPDPLGDYIEHIDCWGKFLDVDKVLIGQVAASDPRYSDYEYVADFFANEISSYGTPYEVYRVFTPGGSYTTPYTNSLIMNKKVYVPIEGNQYDADALAVYAEAMPGYEIISVTSNGWYNTDAFHCRTREMADIGMLEIRHIPYADVPATKDGYTIEANITAYSGQNIYADSVLLYYKVNNGEFTALNMINTETNVYSAVIPEQTDGDVIYYYIHAADESGRSVDHPYIGAPDPHDFLIGNPSSPYVEVTASSIDFGSFIEDPIILTYDINGTNLIDDVELSVVEGLCYSISDDGTNFGSTITLEQNSGNASATIHVKFEPTTSGTFIDSVLHTSTGTNSQYVRLEGLSTINVLEVLSEKINIQPNPNNGIFTVEGVKNVEVQIYTASGQLVKKQFIETSNQSIDISNQDKGVYFVKIVSKFGTITKKIIKY